MRIMILGIDGYIGYSLALKLLKEDHEVYGVDNFSRRFRVNEVGSDSLTPISPRIGRYEYLRSTYRNFIGFSDMPLHHYHATSIYKTGLDAIVHLAEQPSAPYSMRSKQEAMTTQLENVLSTLLLLWNIKECCPNVHLIKLGTMGEYGTPNCDIPEGKIPNQCINHEEVYKDQHFNHIPQICPMKGLLFPRTAGSFYHLSKVHDTHNIEFACRNWGLRSTDIMQGVVFGLNDYHIAEEQTRFDYDEYFGTVLNRFCAQAIVNFPLTVYGSGTQTRGFLPLKDSLQCITIALNNPPAPGEYRTFNQFENIYSVNQLANLVREVSHELRLYKVVDEVTATTIRRIDNPRKEAENHYYNPTHQKLFDLGYVPTTDIKAEVMTLIAQLSVHYERVRQEVIMPKTRWC